MYRRGPRNEKCHGQIGIEMGLMTADGDYDINGDFTDMTNECPVDDRLMKLRSIFDKLPNHYGELVICFDADISHDPGDYDNPPYDTDERIITRAYVKAEDGTKVSVPVDIYDDLEYVYKGDIDEAEVDSRDYDDYDGSDDLRENARQRFESQEIRMIAESIKE